MHYLIDQINGLANGVFDAYLAPLGPLGEETQLVAVSLIVGIAVTLIFSYLLNQPKLDQARRDLRACLFEIWLYRHEPGVVLRAEWELARANGRYLRAFLPPLLVAALIVTPLLIQSYHRFGLVPIPSGVDLLLTAELTPSKADDALIGVVPEPVWASGQGEVTATVRKPSVDQIVWRLRPAGSGIHTLHLSRGGQITKFPLHVGAVGGASVTQARETSPWRLLTQPRGSVLESDSGFSRIFIAYPDAGPAWLIWLTAVSLVAALLTHLLVARRFA